MIDLKILRNTPELVRDSITKRNLHIDLDHIITLDRERLALSQELDALRARRNTLSAEMGKGKPDPAMLSEAKALKEQIQSLEGTFADGAEEYQALLDALPNFLDPTAAV